MPDHVTPVQIQLVGYAAEQSEAGGQRPRPPFESLYFADSWGTPLPPDPAITAELVDEGMIRPAAPLPWRKDEVRALAAVFGLPD